MLKSAIALTEKCQNIQILLRENCTVNRYRYRCLYMSHRSKQYSNKIYSCFFIFTGATAYDMSGFLKDACPQAQYNPKLRKVNKLNCH